MPGRHRLLEAGAPLQTGVLSGRAGTFSNCSVAQCVRSRLTNLWRQRLALAGALLAARPSGRCHHQGGAPECPGQRRSCGRASGAGSAVGSGRHNSGGGSNRPVAAPATAAAAAAGARPLPAGGPAAAQLAERRRQWRGARAGGGCSGACCARWLLCRTLLCLLALHPTHTAQILSLPALPCPACCILLFLCCAAGGDAQQHAC